MISRKEKNEWNLKLLYFKGKTVEQKVYPRNVLDFDVHFGQCNLWKCETVTCIWLLVSMLTSANSNNQVFIDDKTIENV